MLNAEEVKDLYEGWKAALANASRKALDVICDANFTLTTADGRVFSKAEILEQTAAADRQYESWTSSEHRVRFYANTAVLNCRDHVRLIVEGQLLAREERVLAVFFRQDSGAWKLVSAQSTTLPDGGQAS
jgi:hypothetical protein